ncbi:MAG: phosphate transport system permease protein [Thermoplasmata archaeon]|nr:phosphate transport system permease protein [Thermoplasmata archaeon]
MSLRARRRLFDRAATIVCLAFTAAACWPLLSVLWELWQRGHGALSWEFLSSLPTPPALPGGGILHAIVGTLMVVAIGTAIGAPIGLLAGVWLAEGKGGRLAGFVRTVTEAMAGMPSIVAGLFGYALVVSRFGFSAWAGGVALSLLMLSPVTRTAEEALLAVPKGLREASMALGAPRWKTTVRVVLPAAWAGVTTGLLLAVSRIAGETAPLLLTVNTSFFLVTDPAQPVATLPGLIYSWGKSAYDKQVEQAWGAALVLIAAILAVNLLVRFLARARRAKQ